VLRVIYFVSDPQKAARFYQAEFRARRLRPPAAQDHPPEEWIQVKSGGVEIGFHRLGFLKARKQQPPCPFKLVFKVRSVARKRQALLRKGVKMTRIWKIDRGSICDGWDPEGHRFQIADR
jgi:predicted enzyme related to lactoylglutathione lyase